MPIKATSDSPVRDQAPAADDLWRDEPEVRSALTEHWRLGGSLDRMQANPASRTWQVDGHVVKLAADELPHFTAGLHASETAQQSGIMTGAPVRTRAGQLAVAMRLGQTPWVLAVLQKVDGNPMSMHSVPAEALGELLGQLHHTLRRCPATDAWTPTDVLGHMTRGITATHPPAIRQMITDAINNVSIYYATTPRTQLVYGDGPGILSVNDTDISAIIDWGAVRDASIADDIGCWTAHGATDRITLPAYTAAFLDGYRRNNDLLDEEVAAVPLFQRLRIASRACHVTNPEALAAVAEWMQYAFSEQGGQCSSETAL